DFHAPPPISHPGSQIVGHRLAPHKYLIMREYGPNGLQGALVAKIINRPVANSIASGEVPRGCGHVSFAHKVFQSRRMPFEIEKCAGHLRMQALFRGKDQEDISRKTPDKVPGPAELEWS